MDTTRNYSGAGTVACYFRNPSDAERAVDELSRMGIPKKDIGIAISEAGAGQKAGWTDRLRNMFSPGEREEYVGDNDFDTLRSMGLPENDYSYYEDALREGGALVTVNTDAVHREKASSVLKNCGAVMTGQGKQARTGMRTGVEGAHHRIQLLGEMLRVHKERVQKGSVTLRKEVVTDQQTVQVPVSHEELVIERHAGSGNEPVRGDFEHGKEIRVPLTEEQVRVEKRPVVREEIEVGKREVQDTRNVTETVKREEAHIDKEGDVNLDPKKKKSA